MVGLSGIRSPRVQHAAPPRPAQLRRVPRRNPVGYYYIFIAIGLTSIHAGASRDARTGRYAVVVRPRTGSTSPTILRMNFNRYLHYHGATQDTLAKVAAKNFRNGALNPMRSLRKPIPEDEILNSGDAELSHDPVQFCAPHEGGAAVLNVPGRHRPALPRTGVFLAAGRGGAPAATGVRGSTPPRACGPKTWRRRCRGEGGIRKAGVAPEAGPRHASCRTPCRRLRRSPHGRCGFCAT